MNAYENKNLVNPTLAEVRAELQGEQATDTATLLNRIDQLEKDLAKAQGLSEALKSAVDYHVNTINEVKAIVEKEIEKGGWDTEGEFCQELCEALDIDLTEETQVTVTATWNITVRHPRGYDVENELSVDVSLDVDGTDCDIDNDCYPDVEVSAN
jgi:hypothetical protein